MLDIVFNPGKLATVLAAPIVIGLTILVLGLTVAAWMAINQLPPAVAEDAFRWFMGEPYGSSPVYIEWPLGMDPSFLVEWFGGHITQGVHDGHVALDFSIPVGTPVRSTTAGEVVYAGWSDAGYGNLVIVKCGDYYYYYGHLDSVDVEVGDQVGVGTTVGPSGDTGVSTGPHLHYEVREGDTPIDPSTAPVGDPVNDQSNEATPEEESLPDVEEIEDLAD